ncbi:MAG: OsmC family protein [Deltaproteobacteria bacterium]|nr:OsmC family protein [Deltaproteobacteria bacterium]
MKLNNIDVAKLKGTVEALSKDLSKAKKTNRIEGEWNLGDGPQFSAAVEFENGKMKLMADQPTFLGGGGQQPGPMIYCLYGSASCYAATFATMAAMEGITLKRLKVTAESYIDFSKVFGLSENPIAEKVKFILHVESDAPKNKIAELEELAKKRCPAVYCLTNPIRLETTLEIG